ncbi:hypothetical protein [Nocardia brasiliensis]|uniref:hypothetical protein n=1 Tax=Nocardia brasiliensis TaxID=37326 RepID=UPI00114CA5A1|nr:hypothetical protein [Nocardia brasiliensis]
MYVYPDHKDILDILVTTGKAKSVAAATKTGPFSDMRDAYVFAASLAIAMNRRTPFDEMPKSRRDATEIQDRVFLRAEGADEIAGAVSLTSADADDMTREMLHSQLDLLSEEKKTERLALLDQYAHAGFDWLKEHARDESGVHDLILSAVEGVGRIEREMGDESLVQDPLLPLLKLGTAVIE